ncbi:MAG: glycosyltransferase family 39 protein [Candidatus Yanofskybacteria bacterium]|nr:glycosyltransferase family 39 protein [Candidatus Yanofskybacteria bacterium]
MFKYHKLIVIVLLGIVFFLPFFSAQNFSPATDEIAHLPSGYSYWKTGQIVLNPEHPPLVKLMASFPLLFMDLKFDSNDPNLIGPIRNEWSFGSKFLFSNDIGRLLLWGRLSVMFLSVLLGFYIYKWASELFNYQAGILALFLYAFMPVMVANAQFVTTDLPLASFSFVTFYYLWKFSRTNHKKYLVFSGCFLGLALGSKFSATVFLPVIALFVFIYAWQRGREFNTRMRQLVNLALIVAIPAFVVVYFSYLMPIDSGFYLKGLKSVYANWKPGYNFYLNGNFSSSGWWYYFLEAFVIKTPIPALLAFIVSIAFYKRSRMNNWDRVLVFLPMLFFAFVTSIKAHDISVRYLIPAIPFLILYTGGGLSETFRHFDSSDSRTGISIFRNLKASIKIVPILILALAVWYIFSAVSIYPDYLAYFNEFVGGSKNGYKYLDDSNIEWGQDLKRLGKYQASNPGTKVIYSWRNSNPKYYGVKDLLIVDDSGWWREPKGRYAINTFLLIRLQLLSKQKNDPALNWLALYEPVDRIGQSFFVYDF